MKKKSLFSFRGFLKTCFRGLAQALMLVVIYLTGHWFWFGPPADGITWFWQTLEHELWTVTLLTMLGFWNAFHWAVWQKTLQGALHMFHERGRDNLLQLHNLHKLKSDMAEQKLKHLNHSVVLATEFLSGLSRSQAYTPKQRQLMQNTAQEIARVQDVLTALFSNQSGLLSAEEFKVVSIGDWVQQLSQRLGARVSVENKLFNPARVALNMPLFQVVMEHLLEGHLQQERRTDLTLVVSEARGSLLHHDLEGDWAYCHIEIKESFTLLQNTWYLRGFRRMLTFNWQEEVNFQVDAGLAFLKEVSQWHGGLVWSEWSDGHDLTVHLALPCGPTGLEGFAA